MQKKLSQMSLVDLQSLNQFLFIEETEMTLLATNKRHRANETQLIELKAKLNQECKIVGEKIESANFIRSKIRKEVFKRFISQIDFEK